MRRVAMVLRVLGPEKATQNVTPAVKHPKSKELLLLEGAKPLNEKEGYHSAHDAPVPGPTRLDTRCRLSAARDEPRDEGLRGAITCWGPLVRATD